MVSVSVQALCLSPELPRPSNLVSALPDKKQTFSRSSPLDRYCKLYSWYVECAMKSSLLPYRNCLGESNIRKGLWTYNSGSEHFEDRALIPWSFRHMTISIIGQWHMFSLPPFHATEWACLWHQAAFGAAVYIVRRQSTSRGWLQMSSLQVLFYLFCRLGCDEWFSNLESRYEHMSNRQNYCNTNFVLLRLGLSEVAQNLHHR